MRNIFFILVFLNAAFFLWLYSHNNAEAPKPKVSAEAELLEIYKPEPLAEAPEQPKPLPTITGSSESLSLNAPEEHPTPKPLPLQPPLTPEQPKPTRSVEQPARALSEQACLWIGPVPDKPRAVGAKDYLQSHGYKATWQERKNTNGPVKFAYRVFIPPYDSFKAAKEATDKLTENGITDFYMITKSDEKQYAIALGVFSRIEGVKIRREQVEGMGFKTDYEPREREQDTVFWLAVKTKEMLSGEHKKALGAFGIDLSFDKKSCGDA